MISKSLKNTEEIARDFIKKISAGSYDKALVVGLYGDLGSGKTTFTQKIAKLFGVREYVTSPTFVIEKVYNINQQNFKKLVHVDAYRLDSAKELEVLDWGKTLSNPENLIFLEWPERIREILPEDHLKVYFRFVSENEREIEM